MNVAHDAGRNATRMACCPLGMTGAADGAIQSVPGSPTGSTNASPTRYASSTIGVTLSGEAEGVDAAVAGDAESDGRAGRPQATTDRETMTPAITREDRERLVRRDEIQPWASRPIMACDIPPPPAGR